MHCAAAVDLLQASGCQQYHISKELGECLDACLQELHDSDENAAAFQDALFAVQQAVHTTTSGLAVRTAWLKQLERLCSGLFAARCTETSVLLWAWATSFVGSAVAASQPAAPVDAADSARPDSIALDESTTASELHAAYLKSAVSTLGAAVQMLGPLAAAVESDGRGAEEDCHALFCQVFSDLLSLDASVQSNLSLLNAVWKGVSGLLPACSALLRTPTVPEPEHLLGARVAPIALTIVHHIDETLNGFVEDSGTLCLDAKVSTRGIRILRFWYTHLGVLIKHDFLLVRIQLQLTAIVLQFVRVRQLGLVPLQDSAQEAHPVQAAFAQFLIPLHTEWMQKCEFSKTFSACLRLCKVCLCAGCCVAAKTWSHSNGSLMRCRSLPAHVIPLRLCPTK